jgi:hypothetical protein
LSISISLFIYPRSIIDIIKPNNAIASAKISISIIPMNILSVWASALTPASPIIPIARPAARELNPQHNPDDKCENPWK